jgi:hypothetical protein
MKTIGFALVIIAISLATTDALATHLGNCGYGRTGRFTSGECEAGTAAVNPEGDPYGRAMRKVRMP